MKVKVGDILITYQEGVKEIYACTGASIDDEVISKLNIKEEFIDNKLMDKFGIKTLPTHT